MRQIIALLLCGVIALSGCDSKKEEGVAQANTHRNNSSRKGTVNSALIKMLPEKSITDFLPAKTILYINLPELADLTTTISKSPLKDLWKAPALHNVLEKQVNKQYLCRKRLLIFLPLWNQLSRN